MVRVLIAVEGSKSLRESVAAGTDAGRGALSRLKLPSGTFLDAQYAPVPIGEIGTPRFLIEASDLEPLDSRDFIVRAEVDKGVLTDLQSRMGAERVFADPDIEAMPTCGGDPPVGNAGDIQTNLDTSTLQRHGLTGSQTAIAVMDNGINVDHIRRQGIPATLDSNVAWVRPVGQTPPPGRHPVHHGTMCAYDVLMVAPDATLLDYPILGPAPLSSSLMGGALSNALMAYSHLLSWWAVASGPTRQGYDALVVTNSWGVYHPSWDFPAGHPGRYIDNPGHPFNQMVSSLSASNIDIVFAAGNCGSDCPDVRCNGRTAESIMGANAHEDVLSVGGVDANDKWVGYSSSGPAIARMDPEKPDIVAYTHFLGSRAFGRRIADGGTSAACPVAAGCVAALRTAVDQSNTTPGNMIAELEQTARRPSGRVGWESKLGNGIIDPIAAGQSLGVI